MSIAERVFFIQDSRFREDGSKDLYTHSLIEFRIFKCSRKSPEYPNETKNLFIRLNACISVG